MKTLRWEYVFTGMECLSQVAYLVNRFPTLHCWTFREILQ